MTSEGPGFIGHDNPALSRDPKIRIISDVPGAPPIGMLTLAAGIHAYVFDPAHVRVVAAAFTALADQLEAAQAAAKTGDPWQ